MESKPDEEFRIETLDDFQAQETPEPEFKETKAPISFPHRLVYTLTASVLALPADFIKTNRIVSNSTLSIQDILKTNLQKEGFRGLFRGTDSIILSRTVTTTSIYFVQSITLPIFRAYREEQKYLQSVAVMQASSFITGFLSGILSTPFESVLVRAQSHRQFPKENRDYKSFTQAIEVLQKENKLGIVFRGALGSAFFRSFSSSAYNLFLLFNFKPGQEFQSMITSTVYTLVLCSIVYPAEFCRIKIQTAGSNQIDLGYRDVFKQTLKKFGFKGLFSGFSMFCAGKIIHSYVLATMMQGS